MSHDFGLQTASGHFRVDEESKAPYAGDVLARLHEDAAAVVARYPRKRSALLPLLHLVQSVDGYVTGRGIDFCAEVLDLTTAEVSGVATFYTQYKRHPNGRYTVGVCTNTLCAVMGGDEIWERVSEHLGVGHDETTEDGAVTLERIECNAACDYAPVVMANWEFFDHQTPESTVALVDDLRSGQDVAPTRGARTVATFTEVSRVLAGFPDGRADEGVGAGEASLRGLRLAKEHGWTAPPGPSGKGADGPGDASAGVGAGVGAGAPPHSEAGPNVYGSVNTPTNAAGEKPGAVPAQKSEADKHASDATSPKEEGA
jgi:NADH-quinone oxidoreductase subunit E